MSLFERLVLHIAISQASYAIIDDAGNEATETLQPCKVYAAFWRVDDRNFTAA